jgi:eukaryotic-like serine/threonine-protein kinase
MPEHREYANRSLQDLFLAALDLPSGSERDAFLEAACGSDGHRRQKLLALLANHREDEFLQHPAIETVTRQDLTPNILPESASRFAGPYKLLERIGEAGCGEVYVAEQTEPVRRRVALKIVKLGMDTRSVIARFEAERQALALMDHPNIATVLGAGATQEGRPYFVMQLVRGTKITAFCDQGKLPTRERLELFIKVCQAIQHAHQKGIIHRDIKPSNVLVKRTPPVQSHDRAAPPAGKMPDNFE